MHPNLIPIGVIMVHFLNIRTAVRPFDDMCKSDGEACALCYKKLFTGRQHHKKLCTYKSLSKVNETLRLNRYEKSISPLSFCTAHLENFVINQEQNLFSMNHLLYFHCYKIIGSCF